MTSPTSIASKALDEEQGLTTAERITALTALQKAIREELDNLRADEKVEMLDADQSKIDVTFGGQKVGDIRLVTECLSKIEVYPATADPCKTWDLFVAEHGDGISKLLNSKES